MTIAFYRQMQMQKVKVYLVSPATYGKANKIKQNE